jgi:hypothetical protein
MNLEQLLNENWQGKSKYSERTRASATFPTKMPRYLTWNCTRAVMVESRLLTA